jgi:cellulose synthase/poly-beta-1,6-N-acetylglucosamine synthase-like glycosyltransferase
VALLWPILGYPALLAMLGSKPRRVSAPASAVKSVCVVITTVGGEEVHLLRQKLANTLRCDTAAFRREIIVVVDGVCEESVEIVDRYADAGVRSIVTGIRQGKSNCQILASESTDADVVVFTDLSAQLGRDSLKMLLAPFGSAAIGCTSGIDLPLESTNEGEEQYVAYEMALRAHESDAFGLIGASGCLFAARRHLTKEIRPELTSDFSLPLSARLQGFRTVSASGATCWYPMSSETAAEFRRKVRTVVHGMQVVREHSWSLNPLRSATTSLQMWSHKILRWTTPYMALTVAVSGLLCIADSPRAILMTVIFSLLMSAATITAAWLLPVFRRQPIAKRIRYICMAQAAMVVASLHFFQGRRHQTWRPSRALVETNRVD